MNGAADHCGQGPMRISEQLAAVAAGQVSARDLAKESIARIKAGNDRLHAVAQLREAAALARADQLDAAAAAGQTRGALHGIAILVKELIDVAGLTTLHGSLCYGTAPAPQSAPVVARLEAAGANIIGTTHMVEFAMGSWGTNAARGTPCNPHGGAADWFAGGSSSGSAVAVAAGLVPVALGSDTGGSIRIPAALCGVYGFKPSYGLIPLTGVAPLATSFDTLGALGTSIADLRLVCQIMAGTEFAPGDDLPAALRLAYVRDQDLQPCHPETLANYQSIRQRLQAAGHQLTALELPESLADLQALNGVIVAYEAYQNFQHQARDSQSPMDPHVRRRVLAGALITPARYQAECARMAQMTAEFAAAQRGIDGILLPGTPMPAADLASVDEAEIPLSRYTRMANCLALCGIAMPSGKTAAGAPLALQICGLQGQDGRVLAVAERIDALLRG